MYCSKCGNPVAAGLPACLLCGQAVPVVQVMPAGLTYAPVAAYAGFWLRLAASMIDSLVTLGVFAVIGVPLFFILGVGARIGQLEHGGKPDDAAVAVFVIFVMVLVLLSVVGAWLYHALMESSSWQGTIGKHAMNIVVTDMAGRPVSFGRATGRHFGKILTGMIPLGIGWIMAGFTEKRQAIHDMVASCLVLRR